MRATQLFPRSQYEPEPTIRIVIIPVRCRCVAPPMKNRYTHYRDFLGIKMNGMVIGDADARAVTYIEGGREVMVEFTGSVPVFAATVKEAIRKVQESEVEVFGWVNGPAHDLEIDVVGPLTLVNPATGMTTNAVTPVATIRA